MGTGGVVEPYYVHKEEFNFWVACCGDMALLSNGTGDCQYMVLSSGAGCVAGAGRGRRPGPDHLGDSPRDTAQRPTRPAHKQNPRGRTVLARPFMQTSRRELGSLQP